MKIELHTHCSGASGCADVTDIQLVSNMKKNGFDGFLLVNHINGHFKNYPASSYKEQIDYYLSRFEEVKALANENGIKVFLGAEIQTVTEDNSHQEFIIVGFDKQFLYDNKLFKSVTQEQLFSLADKYGFFMYQAHPFRTGEKTGNPKFMHGAEGLNGHFHHDNNNDKAEEFCEKNSLIKLTGSDYHHNEQPIVGYTIIPDDTADEKQLAKYLFNNQHEIVFDQQRCLEERKKNLERIKESN